MPDIVNTSFKDWVDRLVSNDKELMIFIDYNYLKASVVAKMEKIVNFQKFKQGFGNLGISLISPIYYFSKIANSDTNVAVFLKYLKKIEGYQVEVKACCSGFVSSKRDNNLLFNYESVASYMTTAMLVSAYEKGINSALVLSRDPDLIPAIRQLQNLGIEVAIATMPEIYISNHLITQVDSIFSIEEMMKALDCLQDSHKKVK